MSKTDNGPKNGVWVGLKRCGCCVAVVVDDDIPARAKDVNKSKREFLRDGLSVVNATWDEWLSKYLPSMSAECVHDEPRESPPSADAVGQRSENPT